MNMDWGLITAFIINLKILKKNNAEKAALQKVALVDLPPQGGVGGGGIAIHQSGEGIMRAKSDLITALMNKMKDSTKKYQFSQKINFLKNKLKK